MSDLREALQRARGALADIARSNDMTLAIARKKAQRVYEETTPALSAAPAQEMTDESMRDLVDMPILGAVPRKYIGDEAVLALQRMAASIQIVNRVACWDHMTMFELRDLIVDRAIAADRASRLPELGEGDWPAPSGYLITEFGNQTRLSFDKQTPNIRDEVTGMTCEPLYTRAAVEALVRGKT
jgi:hypothetical protein